MRARIGLVITVILAMLLSIAGMPARAFACSMPQPVAAQPTAPTVAPSAPLMACAMAKADLSKCCCCAPKTEMAAHSDAAPAHELRGADCGCSLQAPSSSSPARTVPATAFSAASLFAVPDAVSLRIPAARLTLPRPNSDLGSPRDPLLASLPSRGPPTG